MINILYIHQSADSNAGSAKALLHFLTHSREHGYAPLVILPQEGELSKAIIQMGIKVVIIPFSWAVYPPTKRWIDYVLFPILLLRRKIKNIFAAKKIAQLIKNEHIAITHTNTSVIDVGFKASQMAHIPHVWHLREYGDSKKDFFNYYTTFDGFCRQLTTSNNYSVCITKDIKQYFQQQNSPNAYVIYDGVLSAKQVIRSTCKENYFLFVGRLEQQKGIEDLLKAYALYVAQNANIVQLSIIGYTDDSNYEKKLHEMAMELHITNNIVWLGKRNNVQEFMSHALAVIVPSKHEGFGFITTEAMFSGTLVIGHNDSGTKEQFDNGLALSGQEIGLRYHEINELAQLLSRISLENITDYNDMIQHGQDSAIQLYSIENNINNTFNLYKKILHE